MAIRGAITSKKVVIRLPQADDTTKNVTISNLAKDAESAYIVALAEAASSLLVKASNPVYKVVTTTALVETSK